jgi:hypothetical protein
VAAILLPELWQRSGLDVFTFRAAVGAVLSPWAFWLFDHLVRAYQDVRREGKVKRFCRPSIDDHLKNGGLLNRNFSGLSASEYLVNKIAEVAKLTREVRAIAQQATQVAELSEPVRRRQMLF